jgi:ubiquitin C-terminal hydrolase
MSIFFINIFPLDTVIYCLVFTDSWVN